jgi:hypothetical protein
MYSGFLCREKKPKKRLFPRPADAFTSSRGKKPLLEYSIRSTSSYAQARANVVGCVGE